MIFVKIVLKNCFMKKFFYIFSVCVILASCTKTLNLTEAQLEIAYDITQTEINYLGGETYLFFTTNQNWKVSYFSSVAARVPTAKSFTTSARR